MLFSIKNINYEKKFIKNEFFFNLLLKNLIILIIVFFVDYLFVYLIVLIFLFLFKDKFDLIWYCYENCYYFIICKN